MNNDYKISKMNPVRNIGPVYGSVSGIFSFRKEKSIRFESTLERDLLTKLEFSSSVLDVLEQPVEIPYITAKGNSSTYTPDFLIEYRRSDYSDNELSTPPILLIEVKPKKVLIENWTSLRLKFKAAINYAREEGWVFHIYDERKIRDTYLTNIQFLRRYTTMDFDPIESKHILETLLNMGQSPFSALVNFLYKARQNQATGISHIWHLIAIQKISCDLSQSLSNNMVIWINTDTSL